MNDKVDTKFSQMHSNFILLKEKENKLNYHIKKEEILKQKSQNLPEHILEKYSSSSKLPSRVNTVYGVNKNHFGSVSGRNKSFKTISPDKLNKKSGFQNRINEISGNGKMGSLTHETPNFKNEVMSEEFQEQVKMARKVQNSKQKAFSKQKFEINPSMVSEGLQNMSVTKIHNRFNKMISEFDKLNVNQSFLENGFQDMNANFGGIDQSNPHRVERGIFCNF